MSVVLLLRAQSSNRHLNVLLSADAGTGQLERALHVWEEHANAAGVLSEFHATKIPHHGSIGSHDPRLCESRSKSDLAIAACSVGTRFKVLPDREVLRDYVENGWSVYLTTKRTAKSRKHLALQLFGRSTDAQQDINRFDLRISWNPTEGIRCDPANAMLVATELDCYETAKGEPA